MNNNFFLHKKRYPEYIDIFQDNNYNSVSTSENSQYNAYQGYNHLIKPEFFYYNQANINNFQLNNFTNIFPNSMVANNIINNYTNSLFNINNFVNGNNLNGSLLNEDGKEKNTEYIYNINHIENFNFNNSSKSLSNSIFVGKNNANFLNKNLYRLKSIKLYS